MSNNEFDEEFRRNEESIARGESEQNCKEDEDREETEQVECEICGSMVDEDEAVDSLGQGYVCNDCFNKNRTLENAIGWDKEVTVNFIFILALGKEEINKILIKEIEKLPKSKQQELIDNFINEDKSGFAEYLIEKGEE